MVVTALESVATVSETALTSAFTEVTSVFTAATAASVTNTVFLEDIPLPGGSDCEFYIENSMAVSMLIGWTLKITPKTDVGATA